MGRTARRSFGQGAARESSSIWKRTATRARFSFGRRNGKEAFTAPVLWIAGCQGVGAATGIDLAMGDCWFSIAAHMAIGIMASRRWCTLGTLRFDEKRNYAAVSTSRARSRVGIVSGARLMNRKIFWWRGNTALIVHQGTQSGYDLKPKRAVPDLWRARYLRRVSQPELGAERMARAGAERRCPGGQSNLLADRQQDSLPRSGEQGKACDHQFARDGEYSN
jgi:hypothetical protein